MKKNVLFVLILLCVSSFSYVKAQKTAWAFSIGNQAEQFSYDIATDKDGNSIVTGSFKGTNIDFDPSPKNAAILSSKGNNDIFLAKYDKYGQYVWAFRIGGTDNDAATNVTTDTAGNIYISGWFRGTGVDFDPSAASDTLNSNGEYGEDPDFGGDGFLAKFTNDGGYLWALNMGSTNILDTGGDICIDKEGNVLWTGSFTGSNVDFDPSSATHFLSSLGVTGVYLAKYNSDGKYIWAVPFGGLTVRSSAGRAIVVDNQSNIYLTGHFEGTIDLNPSDTGVKNFTSYGCEDFFVVKLDSTAKYQWGFNIGGTNCDYVWGMGIDSSNNIYIDGYYSSTNADFNPGAAVSQMSTKGGFDAFLAKYDKDGNYVFSHSFGSYGDDMAFGIAVQKSGYALSGAFSGTVDVDPGTPTFNLTSSGGSDIFVSQFDLEGKFQNSFKIGGALNDVSRSIVYGPDEQLYATGYFISSGVDFDPSGTRLSLSSNGGNDFFVADYTNLELINTVKGFVFLDNNINGSKDSSEPFFNKVQIISLKQNADSMVTFTSDGQFAFAIDTGSYVTKVSPNTSYYTVVPQNHATNFSTYLNTDSVVFGLQPIPGIQDLATYLIPVTPARPGFSGKYNLIYQNNGTDTIATGYVELIIDSNTTFLSSSPVPGSVKGDTVRWNFSNLKPWSDSSIYIDYKVAIPPIVNNGDTLHSVASIYPIATDTEPSDNRYSLLQNVVGSYDPNDKSEIHGGLLKTSQAANGEYLQYMIRFQNTGTDTAFNISIVDTLSSNLDWKTLKMVTASHNYKLNISKGNRCTWLFENVKLVDSFRNEARSHGYLVFRIKPKSLLSAAYDTIKNKASIYFDYNAPVLTNTAITTLEKIVLPLNLTTFIARKDGKNNFMEWTTAQEVNLNYFNIENSTNGKMFSAIGKVLANGNSSRQKTYSFTHYQPEAKVNYYRLKMVNKEGKITYTGVRKINNSSFFDVTIYPNPVKDNLFVKIDSVKDEVILMEILNAKGRLILTKNVPTTQGNVIKNVNLSVLPAGSYFINFKSSNKQTSVSFQKL